VGAAKVNKKAFFVKAGIGYLEKTIFGLQIVGGTQTEL
jgi:hypothetical protein